jgi:LacI family transcriptional regulator
MVDVARTAGVSTATVSHVLSGARVVRQIRRERVLKAIDFLDYSPNQVAASLRVRRSAVIGIIVPDIISSFFSKIVRQIEDLASGSKYQILLADTQEDPVRERERVRALIRRRPDGLIFVPCRDHTDTLEDLRKSEIPTVLDLRGSRA